MVKLSSKNLSQFTFNGGANRVGKTLSFDPDEKRGSAFYFKKIKLGKDTSFQTNFRYQPEWSPSLTFMLQNDPRQDNALSSTVASGSYGIASSIGIELDGYSGRDVNINKNGSLTPLASALANLDLSDSEDVNVWIDYNGKNDLLKVFTSSKTSKPRNPLLSTKVDIANVIGNKAYVGFGGYSYRVYTKLDIVEWEFSTSEPKPKAGKNINGDNKNNRLSGTNKSENINGKNGNDTLIGAQGNDSLVGGGGADELMGSSGNDILIGGGGADELMGGSGNDILIGGSGADDFLLGNGKAYRKKNLGTDTIKDFQPGVDNIILDTDTFVTLHSEVGEGFSIEREFRTVKNKKAVSRSVADIVYDRATGDLYYNAKVGYRVLAVVAK